MDDVHTDTVNIWKLVFYYITKIQAVQATSSDKKRIFLMVFMPIDAVDIYQCPRKYREHERRSPRHLTGIKYALKQEAKFSKILKKKHH